MTCTITNTHRMGYQPSRARVDGAFGQAWRLGGHRLARLGHTAAARPSTTWTYVARQANPGASPAVSAFDGILAVPTMGTKCTARHLAPRST
jgi:hypothetical protein